MTDTIGQFSFTTGEVDPALHARVDIPKYGTSLKVCENFIPLPFGGVRNRSGFRFISQTANNAKARLVPFRYSQFDNYALEFTNQKMRLYRDGVLVLTSGGVPYELTTPLTDNEIEVMTFAQSADTMILCSQFRKPQQLKRFGHANWTISDVNFLPALNPPATLTAVATAGTGAEQVWKYQVTAVLDDGSNALDESLPVTSNAITVFSTTLRGDLSWPAVAGATYYNVYKDNAGSGIYGFIGRAVTLAFTDVNIVPVKTDTAPTGSDPFVGVGNYPAAVAYYQQRLVFGGTANRSQTLWFSKTGLPNNFGYSIPSKDDDAITWTMASTQINRIKHLISLTSLLVFTDGAEWSIEGGSGGLTSRTISGNPQTYNGIGNVRPIPLNNAIMYAQEQGTEVTAFSFNYDSDGFIGSDANILSRYLLEDFKIKEWAYQKIPYSVIWSVREDGLMLGLTYNKEQQVVAWHHHVTKGLFESVCSIPEGREYSLYASVRRYVNGTWNRYVERMDTRKIPLKPYYEIDVAQAFFVDSGLTYDGRNNLSTKTVTLTGGTSWQYPDIFECIAFGFAWTSNDIGKQVVIGDLRLNIVGFTSASSVDVTPLGTVPEILRNNPTSGYAIGVTRLTGLSHLEGETLSVLGDGNVLPQVVVSGGSITISQACVIVNAGLPYASKMETLEVTQATSSQTSLLGNRKLINSLTVMIEQSRGILAGKDFDHLWEYKQRNLEAMEEPTMLQTGKAHIYISADWASKGTVCIRQEDPLPLGVLAVLPEVEVGGKL